MGDDEVREYGVCVLGCMKERTVACIFDPEVCIPFCAAKCAVHLPHNYHSTIAPQNYACNIACTFTQCKNYMMLNDGKRLGECIASCSDNYCAKKAALI
ncbi:hypothetical protein KY289_007882 [Solanum tuberosum]|nr:hypothetical protein KY289_007882 [Solanum tuberosum]